MVRCRLSTLSSFALAALFAAGCSNGSSGGSGGEVTPPTPDARVAVVTTADFQSPVGLVATVDLDSFAVANDVAEVSNDPFPRTSSGFLYVVNRFFADNVQILDPDQDFATVAQYSTENGSNPQDIAVVGSRAFIPRFEPDFSDVLVLDLTDGSTIGTVDLTAYADTATDATILPRPQAIQLVDGVVWVALGQFDATFSVYGRGSLVAINPGTLEVFDAISLDVQNPTAFAVEGSDLYVAASGLFFPVTLSGGVVKIDTTSGAVSSVLAGDALGGNLGSIAVVDDQLGYIQASIVNDAATASTGEIRSFNPSTGAVGDVVFTCDGFTPGFAYNGVDRIVALCGATEAPSLSVLDAATGATLAGPLATTLPPTGVDFL